MTKILLQIFFLLSISCIVLVFNSDTVKSCGPYFDSDDYYKIFEEELFNINTLKPFWLSEYIFKEVDEDGSIGPKLDNLNEWLKYFNNKPVIDDLEKFIYKSTEDDLELFISSPEKLAKEWKNNSVFIYADREKVKTASDYLIFAKKCEPFVSKKNEWDELKIDSLEMNSLINRAKEILKNTEETFFKERYIYQAIRLAHYSRQFEKAMSLFLNHQDYFIKNSLMYYWSLAHYAGALRSSGNYAKANVLFSRVFDNCPSRSRQSLISFRYSDSLFSETLKECENNHDKVLVYTLAAYKEYYLETDAVREIYKFEPNSPYLSLILSRTISSLEREILPSKVPWYNYKYYLEPKDYYYLDTALYELICRIADENKTENNHLWNYAAGYVSSLLNRPEISGKYFFEAKRLCPKDDLDFVKRIQIAEVICKVNSLKKIDETTEADLHKELSWLKENESLKKLRSEDALLYIMNTLAKKYWYQRDTIKSHLCFGISGRKKPWENFFTSGNPFGYNISVDYHIQPVQQLYKLIKSNEDWSPWGDVKISEWMKFLMNNYFYSDTDLEDILIKEYISKGMFENVISKLESRFHHGRKDDSFQLPADPFLINIKDCHDCDYTLWKDTVYTLLSFSKKMIELRSLAVREKNKNKSAEYYFLLANGYYNITFYGNCWTAASFNTRGGLSSYYTEGENYPFYDCSKAEQLYLKAAAETSDKEFAARCYFMAAKCEQNRFYNIEKPSVYGWYSKNYDPKLKIKNEKFRSNFKTLVDKYSDTQFYNEALKECKYFNNFVMNY